MTKKERKLYTETFFLVLTLVAGIFTIPALINAHDSMALIAAIILSCSYAFWVFDFLFVKWRR